MFSVAEVNTYKYIRNDLSSYFVLAGAEVCPFLANQKVTHDIRAVYFSILRNKHLVPRVY